MFNSLCFFDHVMRIAAALAASTILCGGCGWAQEFPSRQITIVVPVPPGGGSDLWARLIAPKLGASFNRIVLIDNKPGAGSTIGTEAVVRAQPDGHTLLFVSSSITLMSEFYSKPGFDPRHDLAPVSQVVSVPQILTIHPSLSVRTVKEFVALAKAKPGALTFGSSGVGSGQHLAMELFKLRAGISANHVPYRGAAPMQVSLLSGETQFAFLAIPLVQAHLKTGKLRALGLSALKRSAIVPAIPTIHEAGIADFEALQWQGFFVPAKVPAPIVDRLHREIVKALQMPDMKDRFTGEGAEIVGNSPKEFATFFEAEIKKWADVVRQSGTKLE
jgi:tripartite-type tricarboxylate transporter receptor subunit TctC